VAPLWLKIEIERFCKKSYSSAWWVTRSANPTPFLGMLILLIAHCKLTNIMIEFYISGEQNAMLITSLCLKFSEIAFVEKFWLFR
jgi:hypothetical protein